MFFWACSCLVKLEISRIVILSPMVSVLSLGVLLSLPRVQMVGSLNPATVGISNESK